MTSLGEQCPTDSALYVATSNILHVNKVILSFRSAPGRNPSRHNILRNCMLYIFIWIHPINTSNTCKSSLFHQFYFFVFVERCAMCVWWCGSAVKTQCSSCCGCWIPLNASTRLLLLHSSSRTDRETPCKYDTANTRTYRKTYLYESQSDDETIEVYYSTTFPRAHLFRPLRRIFFGFVLMVKLLGNILIYLNI